MSKVTINERMWNLNNNVGEKYEEEFEMAFATDRFILDEYEPREAVKILSDLYEDENCIEGENDEWFVAYMDGEKEKYKPITEELIKEWEDKVFPVK